MINKPHQDTADVDAQEEDPTPVITSWQGPIVMEKVNICPKPMNDAFPYHLELGGNG
jgi:hypothetical protein